MLFTCYRHVRDIAQPDRLLEKTLHLENDVSDAET